MSYEVMMNPGQFSWFAFHVRAKFEEIVAINLSRKGFEPFLPTYKPRNGVIEQRHCEIPLFPNYVFCRVQAEDLSSLLMTPGVMQIAGTAAGVKPVDEDEIAAIKRIVRGARYYQPYPFWKTGRKVRVAGGELHNLEGMRAESRNGNGIILGISLLRLGALEQDLEQAIGTSPHHSGGLDERIRFTAANVVFDSFRQNSLAGARGIPDTARSLVLQAEDFDIHLQICRERERREILGQILSRGANKDFVNARLYLLRNGEKLQTTTADGLGEFNFIEVPEGTLSLQVELPSLTITGMLNC